MDICFSTFLRSNKVDNQIIERLGKLDDIFDASCGEYGSRCNLKNYDIVNKTGEKDRKYAFAHFIVDIDDNLYISNRVTQSGNKVCSTPRYKDFYDSIPGDEVKIADRLGKEVSKNNVDYIMAEVLLEYNQLVRPVYIKR